MDAKTKKIIRTILIVLLVVVVKGGSAYMKFQHKRAIANTNQETTVPADIAQEDIQPVATVNTDAWQVYEDKKYGFSVKYPQDWVTIGNFGGPDRAAFGQKKSIGTPGYDGDFFILPYSAASTDIDTVIKDVTGDHFIYEQEKKENIMVNGMPATRVTATTPLTPDWYFEGIVIERNNTIFFIENGGIKNDSFTAFYQTFKPQ